jgi:hypothetical protein
MLILNISPDIYSGGPFLIYLGMNNKNKTFSSTKRKILIDERVESTFVL